MQIRNPLKNELGRVIELEDRVFRIPHKAETSMGDEFPLLLGENNLKNIYCAYDDDNTIVSVVALLARDILIDGVKYKAGSIGAVCTDEKFRGQGIAGTILRKIHAELRDSVDFVIISGAGKLYTEFGARLIRNCYSYEITRNEENKNYSFSELNHDNIGEAVRIQSLQSSRFIRTHDEFEILLNAYSINYWPDKVEKLLVRKNGIVAGYILLSILDREEVYGIIKETAGLKDFEVIEAAAVLKKSLSLKKICYSSFNNIDNPLVSIKKLDNLPETFMIFNIPGVCNKLNIHSKQKTGQDKLFSADVKSSSVRITYKNEEAILSSMELLSLTFDIDSDIYSKFSNDTQSLLKKIFPLQFPQTGINFQ